MIAVLSKFLAGLAVAGAMALAAASPAWAQSPLGIWEPDNRESRYEFTTCGRANHFLCAELIWIREDKIDDRNIKYLNTYLIEEAMPVREGVWRGRMTLEGFNLDGTLRMTSANRMELQACALFVICENVKLRRVRD